MKQEKRRTNFLQLINAENAIEASSVPEDLVVAPFSDGNQQLCGEVAEQLEGLVDSLTSQNKLIVTSGYRSYEEQERLYERSMKKHGAMYTKKYVARPGCSEHQLGLAVDVGIADADHDEICPTFEGNEISERFLSKMALYGFILRYPRGKEEVTGIAYEPWHFRYVGRPHSEIIALQNWTLEEYHHFLKRQEAVANES